MNKKRLPKKIKEGISIIVFSLIFCLAILLVQPLSYGLNKKIKSSMENLITSLENLTGLSVSYKSLSPAVFSGIKIKNIRFSDAFGGDEVLEIKDVSLKYSFSRLLAGDFLHMFKSLSVEGITVSLDQEDNSELFRKLAGLFTVSEKELKVDENSSKKSGREIEKDLDLSSQSSGFMDFLQLSMIFDLYIKNVHLRYSMGSNSADVFFRSMNINARKNLNQVKIKTNGSLLYYASDSGVSYSCNFNADGNLTENFEGSSANFHLSNLTDGNFNFKRLNLLFNYENHAASFSTVQNSYPFVLNGSYNFQSGIAQAFLKTVKLTAGNLISVKKSSQIYEILDGLVVSLKANIIFDSKKMDFKYGSAGNIFVKDSVFSGGEEIDFSFEGNEKALSVNKLELAGPNLNGDFSGKLLFSDLKLSGALNLYNYTLENGNSISTEIFFEPQKKGFMAFAPQLMFDDKAFTALQFSLLPNSDSLDFNFEFSDYSHLDYGRPGTVNLSGSYLTGTNYVQANLSCENMFLDSVASSVVFFLKQKIGMDFLSPYLFNAELYVSSDFKTLSYNMPYLLVANTKKDDQFVYVSIDGNDTSISVSRLDLISGGELSTLSAQVDFSPDSNEAFLTSDITFGSIPYHLQGSYIENSFNLTGDYGLSLEFRNSGSSRFDGSFVMENFPVMLMDSIFTFSLDSSFAFNQDDGINVIVSKFEAEDSWSKFVFHPRLFLSGNVTKYGAFFDNISYSDRYSALSGPLNVTWNINDNVFSSASLDFNMKNQLSSEGIEITADVSNMNENGGEDDNLFSSLYLNSQIQVTNLGLSRFLTEVSDNNQATGTFIASGTLDSPYIAANLDSIKIMLAGSLLSLSGSGYVEEKDLSIENLNVSYSGLELSGIKAALNLEKFDGKAEASFDANFMGKTLEVPMKLTVSDAFIPEGEFLPKEMQLRLNCNNIGGSLLTRELPLDITVLYSDGNMVLNTSDFFGLSGFISKNGDMDFSILPGKCVNFKFNGNMMKREINLNLDDVSINLPALTSYLNIDEFKIYRGLLKGNMQIGGINSDPDFGGGFTLSQAEFSLPSIVSGHVFVPKVNVVMNQNQISVQEFKGALKKGSQFLASADVFFDRWFMDRVEAKLRTQENSFLPFNLKIPIVELKGDVACDIGLVFQDNVMDVDGLLAVKKTNIRVLSGDIIANSVTSSQGVQGSLSGSVESAPLPIYVHTDIDIALGQHVNLTVDPILRAVFVPDTKFNFKCDTEDQVFTIDGDIQLRTGDIAYLNRNFYLKNGIIRFDKNETSINPYITVTAETRERDDDGNDVRIILTAQNQSLNDFHPQFSAIPPKSEIEIQELLGQIAIGDSDKVSNFFIAAGDYAIQSTLGRTVENTLREYLNFDIFSIRTNVLQTAIKQTLSNNSADRINIGNYLDNSTVYIGKYLGSALYADAMMHLSYDDADGFFQSNELGSLDGKLSFQPEIGFEMDISQIFAPLWNVFLPKIGLNPDAAVANIRWSLSSDMQFGEGFSQRNLTPESSVTLSWKFSF